MTKLNTVVVTGGSAGIGLAICKMLLDVGYEVISLARRDPDFTHKSLHSVRVDLMDMDATAKAAANIANQFQVTNVVHNAGVIRPALLPDVKLADLEALTHLHLGAAILLNQAFLPAMRQAGAGRIVTMSSRAVVGLPTRTSYAGTKAAIIAMTRTWAMELGPMGITVNCIAPGPVVTDLFTDVVPEDSDKARAMAKSLPRQRLGRPEDVARAALFFLDPANDWITGQTLYVCGGASLGSITL